MAMGNDFESKFDSLLAQYKQSFDEPVVSANFSPTMWKNIEARKAMTFGFERLAQKFVTVALGLCMVMGLFLVTAIPQTSSLSTYIDALADEHEILAYSDVTPTDAYTQQGFSEKEN